MALLFNIARMTTATTGTGTITLGSAVSGFLTFALAGVADGDVVTYAIEDGVNREIGRGTYTATGTTLTRTVLKSTNADAAINLTGSAEVFITAAQEDILSPERSDTLTVGYRATAFNAGTKSSVTFTPDAFDGNMQRAVNGGAHTLAVPTGDCTMIIQYTNNASAGAITTSSYTLVDGDSLTTVNGDDFMFYITVLNSFSRLTVVALQ